MKLTACDLSGLLSDAKEAHTRYEERFAIEGVKPPEHRWQDWYARYMIQRIRDREYNELFGEVECTVPLKDEEVPVLKDTWKIGL